MNNNTKDQSESTAIAAPVTELSLTVKAQDGNVICFKLKKNTVLKKLMDSYCQRHGVNLD